MSLSKIFLIRISEGQARLLAEAAHRYAQLAATTEDEIEEAMILADMLDPDALDAAAENNFYDDGLAPKSPI